MLTTLNQRLEQARSLGYAIQEQYNQGIKHGEVRFKSIIDVVNLVDELVGDDKAPDETQVVELMTKAIVKIREADERRAGTLEEAEKNRLECYAILWELLRNVNRLSPPSTPVPE